MTSKLLRACFMCSAFALQGVSFATPVNIKSIGTYTITDLGSLAESASVGLGINDLGQVVGHSATYTGTNNGFVSQGEQMIDIGGLSTIGSEAYAINRRGLVVGRSFISPFEAHAFVTDAQGHMSDLGTLGGSYSEAKGINKFGLIVGSSYTADNTGGHVFVANTKGYMVDLGTLGGAFSFGEGINNWGQTVGSSQLPGDALYHAFATDIRGHMADLGTLGGTQSWGTAINDRGQAVGYSYTKNDASTHAFLSNGRRMIDLGSLNGGYSEAHGLNNSGQVVGSSSVYVYLPDANNIPVLTLATHAFVAAAGTMTDLNDLIDAGSGWTLLDATAINNQGQITGYGVNALGQTHAFLLTPVGYRRSSDR